MDDFYKKLEEEYKIKRKNEKIISAAQDRINKRKLNARRRIEEIKMCRELGIEID